MKHGSFQLIRTYSGGEKCVGTLDVAQSEPRFFQCHEYGTMSMPSGYRGDFSKLFSVRFSNDYITIFCGGGCDDLYQSIHPIIDNDCWVASGIHYCAKDIYKTNYSYSDMVGLRVEHIVSGPKKDYKSVSAYSKNIDG